MTENLIFSLWTYYSSNFQILQFIIWLVFELICFVMMTGATVGFHEQSSDKARRQLDLPLINNFLLAMVKVLTLMLNYWLFLIIYQRQYDNISILVLWITIYKGVRVSDESRPPFFGLAPGLLILAPMAPAPAILLLNEEFSNRIEATKDLEKKLFSNN